MEPSSLFLLPFTFDLLANPVGSVVIRCLKSDSHCLHFSRALSVMPLDGSPYFCLCVTDSTVPPSSAYVEALTPKETVFADGAFREVMMVK